MKTLISLRALALIYLFATCLLTEAAQAKQLTSPDICKQLGDRVGVYMVRGSQVLPLRAGNQTAKWTAGGFLYFVVGENDGRPEMVDHYRVLTTAPARQRNRELEVGLDRSAARSDCNLNIFGLLRGYGSEKHRQTTVKHYNKKLDPANKDVDDNLNEWHLQWNAAQSKQAKRQCDYTADYVPSFDGTDSNPAQPTGFIGAAVAANLLPANGAARGIESVRMVLVHRQEDENSCLAIILDSEAKPALTTIQHMRFRNKKARFAGGGMVIRWTQ